METQGVYLIKQLLNPSSKKYITIYNDVLSIKFWFSS
jgi:hypothetical protein